MQSLRFHVAYEQVYNASGYTDDLMYAAAWLHRATQEPTYLTDAKQFYQQLQSQSNTSAHNFLVNWDNQYWLALMLMWEATGEVCTMIATFVSYVTQLRETNAALQPLIAVHGARGLLYSVILVLGQLVRLTQGVSLSNIIIEIILKLIEIIAWNKFCSVCCNWF